MVSETAPVTQVGGSFPLGVEKRFLRVSEHFYTDVTFILILRFSLRSENLEEKLH